jgi:hypothetical protein
MDGSNLRFGWSKKKGWHKFGTRKLMIDETSSMFGPAIPLFMQKYADDLEKVFKTKEFRSVTEVIVYCEWFGAKSFAGWHDPDDPKDLVLFDVNPIKKGILGPKEFLDNFGHLKVAECLGLQNLNEELIDNVRNEKIDITSKYPIKTEIPEGVICKGNSGHDLWMCKIKTTRYYEVLKDRHPQDWEDLWENNDQ